MVSTKSRRVLLGGILHECCQLLQTSMWLGWWMLIECISATIPNSFFERHCDTHWRGEEIFVSLHLMLHATDLFPVLC